MDNRKNMSYGERPIFPETPEEQKNALEADEQMQEFRRIREEKKNDPYRPNYHFVRPDGYLNDPNGLCFWEGKWHLFYQANDSRIHWGHAVSDDLLQWRDLPFAIYPGVEDHSFSGGTCVDYENHRVIAAYYGYTGYNRETGYRCGTVVATSSDPLLLNWTKVNDGNPVIPDRDAPCWTAEDAEPVEGQKPYQVFDSNIWKEDGVYYIITGGYSRHPETGRRFRQIHLLKCEDDDLLHWEYVKPFLNNDFLKTAGDDGACPYFTKIGDKYLLSHFSHRCMAKYLLGNYDKKTHEFYPVNGGNYISGFNMMVAPSVCTLDDKSAVVLFNTVEQRSQNGWYGTMTLPRKLTVGGAWGDELYMSPAVDLSPIRKNHKSAENVKLEKGKTQILEAFSGNSYEMKINIPAEKLPQTLEIELLRSPDGEEKTVFTFMKCAGGGYAILPYENDSLIMLNAEKSSKNTDVRVLPPDTASLVKDSKEDLNLHIFADKSSVEVFANDKCCVMARVYPERKDSVGVAFRTRGGDSIISRIDFWDIDSIY